MPRRAVALPKPLASDRLQPEEPPPPSHNVQARGESIVCLPAAVGCFTGVH